MKQIDHYLLNTVFGVACFKLELSASFQIYGVGIDATKVGLVVRTAKFKIEGNELRFSNCLQHEREARFEVGNGDVYDILDFWCLHNEYVNKHFNPST